MADLLARKGSEKSANSCEGEVEVGAGEMAQESTKAEDLAAEKRRGERIPGWGV